MGGKQSSNAKSEEKSPEVVAIEDEIESTELASLTQAQIIAAAKKPCHVLSNKNLAMAVLEANEHLFMENAKSHRARLNISLRSLFSTTTNTLSEHQKMMIRSTWKVAISDGKLKPGVAIFKNIFRRCPDLKQLFRLSHVENLDDLPKEERFLRHANVFGDVIDLTVRNMDELDIQMAPALITLGRRHYYKHNVGFRPGYLAVFAQAMIDFVSERLQIPEDKEALEMVDGWWKLTVYMVTKLQHGHALEAMGKRNSKLGQLTKRGKSIT